VLYLFICAVCCMHVCVSNIKYICGYVWLDDFKLLCAFLYVLYVVCMLCHVCVVQCSQLLKKYSDFDGGKNNNLIQSFCHIT
jgi:hypothetical protein